MRNLSQSPVILTMLVAAAWIGNAWYAMGPPGGIAKIGAPGLVAVSMILYVVLHGTARYGGRLIAQFFLVVFVIGWTFETISILTGIPFGKYHYTELMAPFLGHVPVFVLPAYAVMGYASWSVACLILGQRDRRLDRLGHRWVPVLAAVLMVLWDVSMDPLRASVEGLWIWVGGGAHFGVPVLNYLGWLLVTWLMFGTFAALVGRGGSSGRPLPKAQVFWAAVPAFYLTFAVEYMLNPLFGHGRGVAIVLNGQPVEVHSVFASVAVLALATMVPVAMLAAVCLIRPQLVPAVLARWGMSSRRPEITNSRQAR